MTKIYKIIFSIVLLAITNISYGQQKPNIILIIADDLGNADVGYNGGTQIPTPNIDLLAGEATVFSNGYVTASNCGPSRAGIVTGKYQNRFGFESLPDPTTVQLPGAEPQGIPLSVKTIGEFMKELDYNTKAIGKWHVGGKSDVDGEYIREYSPLGRGFDDFFGFLGGAMAYYPKAVHQSVLDGEDWIQEDMTEYLTDAIGREAVEFIDKKKDDTNPFFMLVAFNAVHTPLKAKPEHELLFADEPDEYRRTLCAMMYSMDENIGKVVDKLKLENLYDDTMIIFISDNGGAPEKNYSYNAPYRSGKSYTFEGGIRLPFFMKWKNHIPENIVYDKPVIGIDILPTMLAAAGRDGETEDNFDGKDLLPYMNSDITEAPHEFLFWRRYIGVAKPQAQWAVRDADWKLVFNLGIATPRPMLFKISEDVSEANDLYDVYPEQVARLQAKYDEWDTLNMTPLWGAGYDLDIPETPFSSEDFEAGTAEEPQSVYEWMNASVESEIVANPLKDEVNSSNTCAKIVKTDVTKSATSYYLKNKTIDFSTSKILRFKMYRPRDVVTPIKVQVSHDNDQPRISIDLDLSDVHDKWVQYEIDFTQELIDQGEMEFANNQLRFVCGSEKTDETLGDYYIDDIQIETNTLSTHNSKIGPIKVIPTVVLDEVRFESSDKILSVEVYNMIGQLKSNYAGNDIKIISIAHLNSGNYILNIITANGRESVKVIKK